MSQNTRFWYLSHLWDAKAQTSLPIRAVRKRKIGYWSGSFSRSQLIWVDMVYKRGIRMVKKLCTVCVLAWIWYIVTCICTWIIKWHITFIKWNVSKIAIRGDGKSPDQKVIDMQLQAANLVYIFDVIILSVTANKSGRLTVETSFLPLNSSKGGTLKCKP